MMETEWDEHKRLSNIEKHDLDFADAKRLDWDNANVIPDTRYDYPEPRFWAYARGENGRLYLVAFCLRGEKVRIISFRRANDREEKKYGSR